MLYIHWQFCSAKKKKKKDWETLVSRINVENGIELGFLLE
jgi:hypothetical protein